MRRRTFLTLGTEGIKSSEAVACDVCFYNKSTQKLLIIPSDDLSVKDYPLSNYTPVGVVVIPGSHDVYGTGECAIISLHEMNYNTPDNGGTTYDGMYWSRNYDESKLSNFQYRNVVGSNGNVKNTVQDVYGSSVYFPSDMFIGYIDAVNNPYDSDTFYNYKNSSTYYAPSPYNDDDTRNPAYYQTSSPSSVTNALSDFDGMGNTEILCSLATAQSNWKTANTITNNNGTGYYPAACCCWRYHTDGTKQGDWYLPAMGELGYIMPKFLDLDYVFDKIKAMYGIGIGVHNSRYYFSSTDYNEYRVNGILTTDGGIAERYKNEKSMVRAFLRIK